MLNQKKTCYLSASTGRLWWKKSTPHAAAPHLRDKLKLFGAKEAWGEGDAEPVRSFERPGRFLPGSAVEAQGGEVLTVEGLARDGELSILNRIRL